MVLPDSFDASFNDCSQKVRERSCNEFSELETLSSDGSQYSKFYVKNCKLRHEINNETLSSECDPCPMDVDPACSDESVSKTSLELNENNTVQKDSDDLPLSNSDVNSVESSLATTQLDYLSKTEEPQLMVLDSITETSLIDLMQTCRQVKVTCLQSVESLKEICQNEGLTFNEDCENEDLTSDEDSTCDDVAYEVDMIFGHKIEDKKTYYHIKWKNYSTDQNTWEPNSNLSGCQQAIRYYRAMQGSKSRVDSDLLNYFVKDLISRKPYDILTMTRACALCFGASEKYVKSLKLTISQMKVKIKEIFNFSPQKLSKLQNKLFELMRFGEARKQVLINLKEWESVINSVNTAAYIEVENNVDLEIAPSAFKFIPDYINSVVTLPEEPLTFCSCNDCFKEKQSCCPHDSEGFFAYSKFKRLLLEPGYPIFECNRKCHCDSSCVNRVVQHGQKIKVQIFRTANGCGWGLRTLEPIEKGQFVLEYLGEIITSEAAEARGRIYDYVGRSYLFDLDYGVENAACQYTVDAGHVGNAAHFINHSCDPNLHVFAVWINQPDPNLPRLAFFARRRISRGEELTFDYKMEQNQRFIPHDLEEQNQERIMCRCGSRNCRKYLF